VSERALVNYEPYWQNGTGDPAPVEPQVWQHWENIEDGNWWSSRTACGLTAGAGGPPFYTLAQVDSAATDATVEFIQLGIGSWNPDWSVLADGMTFAGTTYDFEQAPEDEPDFRSCFDGGWKGEFRNQGQCVASFQANDNAAPHN